MKNLWTCSACGVCVQKSDSGDLEYFLPHNAKGARWYHSHRYSDGDPGDAPAHVFDMSHGDKAMPVCEFCLQSCACCRAPVSSVLVSECGLGPYESKAYCGVPEGYGYGRDTYCLECIESVCSSCGGIENEYLQDCECYNLCARAIEKWADDSCPDMADNVRAEVAQFLYDSLHDGTCRSAYDISEDMVCEAIYARKLAQLKASEKQKEGIGHCSN